MQIQDSEVEAGSQDSGFRSQVELRPEMGEKGQLNFITFWGRLTPDF